MNHGKIRWITRTAVLIALLIAVQWGSAFTQAFAGQYITGSLVNCVLAVAALLGGVWSGLTVALISPFAAFSLGIGPKLIQIVPCIALGNATLVLCLYAWFGKKMPKLWLRFCGVAVSAAAKFAVLFTAVVLVVIPWMGDALKPAQVQTFTAMFSWPQLVTALIGTTLAMLILPVLKKAMKE